MCSVYFQSSICGAQGNYHLNFTAHHLHFAQIKMVRVIQATIFPVSCTDLQ
jgi:hypothetical protein